MEREGLEAGIGTDVEAPEGECMKDAQNADPCGPSTWAKKVSSGSWCRSLQFKTAAGVGVEQLYSTLDSLGTYTR